MSHHQHSGLDLITASTVNEFSLSLSLSPQSLAVGQKLPPSTFTFNHTQCILYALGVGMSTKDPDHLQYVVVFVLEVDWLAKVSFIVICKVHKFYSPAHSGSCMKVTQTSAASPPSGSSPPRQP